MSIEAARKKFEAVKKEVEDCQRAIVELQNRYDSLTESIPHLRREVEALEKRETEAFDNYVLGQITEKELKTVQADCQKIQAKEIEASKMIEALGRGIKKTESDLVKLNTECNTAKRAIWVAIADDLRSKIPIEMIEAIRQFALVSFTQIGGSYDFCLKSIFPQPGHEEGIEILQGFREKYQID